MSSKLPIWIIVFLAVLVLPVLAEDPVYQQSTNISLTLPCDYNGTVCTSCNASILSPTGGIIKNNDYMNQTGDYFYINLNTSDTEELGEYYFKPCCLQGNVKECEPKAYKITISGKDTNAGESILFFLLMGVCFILGGTCLWGAWSLDGDNELDLGGKLVKINLNKYLKVFLGFLSYSFLLLILYFTRRIMELLTLSFMDTLLDQMFSLALWILYPLFIFVAVFMLFVKLFLDIKWKKYAVRGLRPRE